jgi:dihydroneopterin triphosphate diphosphatase
MFKIPVSVLVVIHSAELDVLLLERADRPGFWQSVTGSLDSEDETPLQAARREVFEETGIDAARPDVHLRDLQHQIAFEIFGHWRHRYAPGVTHNTEHWFALEVPHDVAVQLHASEHLQHRWLPWQEAAAQCFSWSNRDAIEHIARHQGRPM